MPRVVDITPRQSLNALLGIPANCLWQTTVVGYDVTEWTTQPDGCRVPERSVFTTDCEQAHRIANRWARQ